MPRKAIMVDVDGVVIAHPDGKNWSANLERDLGIVPGTLQDRFFEPHWEDVVHGRAELRNRLAPVLAEIAPTVTCSTLIDYWFTNDAYIDCRLLDELESLRNEGIEAHLATVQEHERASYIWERLGFRSKFDGMHYAAALGFSKPSVDFYRSIERAAGLAPEAIFFIDDKAENIEGARACGWTAALWTGQQTLRELIAEQHWDVGRPNGR
jgi:putative hydrolase of the HAD superfamily